jgi:hypothetical protein
VPTTVADLSSLIQVSSEEDEQKLQKSYAHSKVTLVRPNGERETVMFHPNAGYKSRSPLVAFLSLSALAGISLAVLSHRDDPAAATPTDTKGSFATSALTAQNTDDTAQGATSTAVLDSALKPTPLPIRSDRLVRSDRIIRPGQFESQAERPGEPTRPVVLPVPRESRVSEAPSGREGRSSRERRDARTSGAPARLAAQEGAPRESSARNKSSAANSSAIEEGTDLTFGRRVPLVRIDSENPYQ